MSFDFSGKTAIVTGAGSGIGAAIARELGRSGALVVVSDLDEEAGRTIADEISGAGGEARAFAADVSDPAAMKALTDFAADHGGGLHLAVNNAGIGGPSAPAGEYPEDDWRQVIDVNLNGVFYGLRHQIPAMLASGGGAIVNMASILGSVGFHQASAYVAAKHGVVGLTKAAAMEYAAQGIRINAVGPAFIDTPLLKKNLDDETLGQLAGMHPAGRLGTSEEVSALTCFLLSDRASFITGSYHLVDGAYTAQ
ncbi:SDR family oxidoreductase [Glycocaulis profundi]|nr:SDR family oxidoreductase [Glycocaulis profundi]